MTEDATHHTAEYKLAGFPGAIGSTDATHIQIERLPARFQNSHMGFKMSHTARTYNVTVNHRRQILSSTPGHPARWNDKTLATLDDFMQKMYRGATFDECVFNLYDYKETNGAINQKTVVKRRYRGAWLLVDNGYHAWPTTVPPIKSTTNLTEIRFSAWLESMRKDVECTFGILKGRFRVLKTGVRLAGTEPADNMLLTCCALHNWLLEIDELDRQWKDNAESEWEDAIGEVKNSEDEDDDDIDRNCDEVTIGSSTVAAGADDVPAAVHRLLNPIFRRDGVISHENVVDDDESDESEMDDEDEEEAEVETVSGITPVRSLSLHFFRSKLITHFAIALKRNEVVWP